MVSKLGSQYLSFRTETLLVRSVLGDFTSTADRSRGNGFLEYWTLSNLPLFALAAPMLLILIRSSFWALAFAARQVTSPDTDLREAALLKSCPDVEDQLLPRLAIPQLVLAFLALTNYHVQIITRLSSGYPVWYWWLASLVIRGREVSFLRIQWRPAVVIVRWMVIYGIVQGALFASFLPPA